jgi:outer membrane immunogenic protein
MKKIILATVLAGISSTAALAADLGAPYTKAPMMADQVYSWTGFYIGGDVGGGALSGVTSNFSQPAQNFPDTIQSNRPSATFIGGVHAGYNWQFTPNLVVGVEGDWQSVRSKNAFCRETDVPENAHCSDRGDGFATVGNEVNWVATARARLGWATDRLMVYGTGGAAFGNVKSSLGLSCLDNGCGGDGNELAASTSSSSQKTGWVLGAGAEWMLTRNWIVRAEYQHIDLCNVSLSLSPDCGGCSISSKQDVRLDILRAGVSYKFGG